MKVDCRISPDEQEPYAVICARRMSPTLAEAIALLESEDAAVRIIPGRQDGKVFFLRADDLDLIRTEGREVIGYDASGRRFLLSSPLYMLADIVGERFVRISKSALVRIRNSRKGT